MNGNPDDTIAVTLSDRAHDSMTTACCSDRDHVHRVTGCEARVLRPSLAARATSIPPLVFHSNVVALLGPVLGLPWDSCLTALVPVDSVRQLVSDRGCWESEEVNSTVLVSPIASHATMVPRLTALACVRPRGFALPRCPPCRRSLATASTISSSLYRSPLRDVSDDDDKPLLERSTVLQPSSNHTGTVIWLHGMGEDVAHVARLCQMAQSPSTKFIIPRAPKLPVTALGEHEERTWFDILVDPVDPDMTEDSDGLDASAEQLRALIDSEAALVGAEGVVVAGAAQGGTLALHMALSHPRRLAGVVAFSSYLALPSLYPAHVHAANSRTPVLVVHGRLDRAIPWETFAKPRYESLRKAVPSLPIETRVEFAMDHRMSSAHFMQAMHWIRQRVDASRKQSQSQPPAQPLSVENIV